MTELSFLGELSWINGSQLGQDQLTSFEWFKLCFSADRFSPEAIS